ncbi:MAG: hypothetical protein ACPG75_04045, partial [Alloalcanivorax venustensis]
MYVYQDYDQRLLEERVAQYRDQTRRYLAGQLSEDEFLVLRLQNGLYIQRYAPMLRISVPYGLLSSEQVRTLAKVVREYDKGFCHVSTRQNIQLNWPEVQDVPDILAELASYRHYHLTHHRYTQTDKDPDLVLSEKFPTSRASLQRKFIRDLTGQTGYRQLAA